jgi:hypothetical protein
MAQRSPFQNDTNTSPDRRPASSEDEGAELTRSVSGNVIEQHSLTPHEDGGEAPVDDLRYQRIAIAAYYRAERRGFEPGHEVEDWLEAEREVGEREGAGAVG